MSSSGSNRQVHRSWIRQARIQFDESERKQVDAGLDGRMDASALQAHTFPGYTLEREIHRGGQGTVYRAVQNGTGRRVALKLLHDHALGAPLERARFEREMHVLASLQHPNIVAIHDGGSHDGRFFLVMDYIAGQPLDRYMAGRDCSLRDTITLFNQICEAVNAAHLRGIIHRDIKPANVRVDEYGRPFVLDFGLAKLIHNADDDSTEPAGQTPTMTLTGQFLGSLPWAAPEQAEGSPSRIDVRTDVYALGVLLYQMLTGKFPYPVHGSMKQTLEAIVHQPPVPPRTLRRDIDDELETIVLKCLQKEPARRYQSAGEVARDLHRYLAGEPIEAKRDSLIYVLRKGLRRHWLPAGVAAAFLAVIGVGLIVSLTQWRTAARERDKARLAESKEAQERQRAERENRKLEHVNRFVQRMLSSANPQVAPGGDITARSLLDNASREIDAGELRDQPDVEAAVRITLGRAYTVLGRYETAGVHLERSLKILKTDSNPDDAAVADVLIALAQLHMANRNLDVAEAFARRAISIRLASRIDTKIYLAGAWEVLSDILYTAGKFDEAEAALRKSLAAWRDTPGAHHTIVAKVTAKLANTSHSSPGESEEVFAEAVRMLEQSGAGETLSCASVLSGLARAQHLRRDYAAAEKSYLRAISIVEENVGGPNSQSLNDLESLGLLYMQRRDWQRAVEINAQALNAASTLLGEDSPRVVHALLNTSTAFARLEAHEKGRDAARAALGILTRTGQDQSLDGIVARINLGTLSRKLGDLNTADEAARQCLVIPDEALAGQTWRKSLARTLIGEVLTDRGSYREAESWLTSGYEGLAGLTTAQAHLRERSLKSLVELYEAWDAAEPGTGKAEKAAEWRGRAEVFR